MNVIKTLIICAIGLLFFACEKDSNSTAARDYNSGSGTGGSLARFTIVGKYLYIADFATLNIYDISDPESPRLYKTVDVGFGVETIFPYKDKIFIGSRDGMYIYGFNRYGFFSKFGEARHVRSCDPVVANDTAAYVTLRSGNACGVGEDGLYIYDIRKVKNPVQKSLLRISQPLGLGLKDTVVFVCRMQEGLTLVNVKNSSDPKEMYTIKEADYRDVIPYDDLLICYVSTGLLLYDISNLNDVKQVGHVKYLP